MSGVTQLFTQTMVPVTVVRADCIPPELKDRIFYAAHHVAVRYGGAEICLDDSSTADGCNALDELAKLIRQAESYCPVEQRAITTRA